MALSIANQAEAVRTVTTDPWIFGIGAGTAGDRAVVMAMAHGADTTDYISSVTVDGGKVLNRIVRATDAAGEVGAAELWLWSDGTVLSTPTSVNITADLTSATAVDMQFYGWRITADAQCESIDFDSINGDVANPTVTMSKAGRSAISFGSGYFGANAPTGTLASGLTAVTEDLGNFWASSMYEATANATDQAVGYSTLGSDDVALAAFALAEVAAPVGYQPRSGFVNHANPGVLMQGIREAWHRRRSGIFVPELWTPEGALA